MEKLSNTIWRVSILAFATFNAWLFHDANFLLLILLLLFTKSAKPPRKLTQQQMDDINFKLDVLLAVKNEAKP